MPDTFGRAGVPDLEPGRYGVRLGKGQPKGILRGPNAARPVPAPAVACPARFQPSGTEHGSQRWPDAETVAAVRTQSQPYGRPRECLSCDQATP